MSTGLRIVALVAVLATFGGCGRHGTDSARSAPIVYVDRETQQPVVLTGAVDAPAVNPQTGRRTLMPGLYCPQCQAWHPTPPLEVLQRDPAARRCPECRSPLTSDGPSPLTSDP
jgi:hypothetical protein